MEKKEISKFSNEQLAKEETSAKVLLATFIVAIVVIIAVSIYFFFKNGFGLINLAVILFIPIAVALWKNYQAVKKEVASRNSQ